MKLMKLWFSNVYVLYDDFMRFGIVVFVHHIVYVACAPCERKMMASSGIICAYITQSFAPRLHRVTIWIHMGSVATTPKVWAIGRGVFA